MIAIGELSLPALFSMSLSLYFLSLCPTGEGSDRMALVGTWHPARVKPPHGQRQLKQFHISVLILALLASFCASATTWTAK